MSWPSNTSSSSTPCVSFIGIVDFSQEARWLYMTDSVIDLLGFEPRELIGRPSLELVHPDEFPRVRQLHYDTIQMDKAAVLVYLRLRHKDPYKGYILCGISRTVVHNVLVGSVSFASPGAKALHNASTAQEITVISQGAANFEFRRWHDPSPLPPSPTLAPVNLPPSPPPSSSSKSSWGTPSPQTANSAVPTASSIRHDGQAYGPERPPPPPPPSAYSRHQQPEPRQYSDEEFEPERSPSPITGRPRPRRPIIRTYSHQSQSTGSSGYRERHAPFSPEPAERSRPSQSPPESGRFSDSPPPLSARRLSESSTHTHASVPGSSPPGPGRSPSPLAPLASPSGTAFDRDRSEPESPAYSSAERSTARRGRSYSLSQNGSSSSGTGGGRNEDGRYYGREGGRDRDPRSTREEERGRERFDSPPSATYSDHSHTSSLPLPPPRPALPRAPAPAPEREEVITFPHLPNKSFRTAFILDRFSVNCTVLYCSNDLLVESTHAIGRNFFDFVAQKDEGIVRSWIECVKGWGVNERGQPSDGGFGFGRFNLLVGGRESISRLPEPMPHARHRQGSTTSRYAASRGSRHHHNHRDHLYSNGSRSITGGGNGPGPAYYQQRLVEYGEQFAVDAIFSAHSDGLMVILRKAL